MLVSSRPQSIPNHPNLFALFRFTKSLFDLLSVFFGDGGLKVDYHTVNSKNLSDLAPNGPVNVPLATPDTVRCLTKLKRFEKRPQVCDFARR